MPPNRAAAIEQWGAIVGVDLSGDMVAQARRRSEDNGWTIVTLIEAPAVANVVRHLRAGARVASVGARLAGNPVVDFFVRRAARNYVTTFSGLDRPWRELERHLGEMQHRRIALGGAYVAWGSVPGGRPE